MPRREGYRYQGARDTDTEVRGIPMLRSAVLREWDADTKGGDTDVRREGMLIRGEKGC
jgi:hypothetical protein